MAKELRTAEELSDMIVSALGVREIEIQIRKDHASGWQPTVVASPGDLFSSQRRVEEIANRLRVQFALREWHPASQLASGSPIMRHPLAAVEAVISLRGPVALISPFLKVCLGPAGQKHAPCGLEIGARLVERSRGASRHEQFWFSGRLCRAFLPCLLLRGPRNRPKIRFLGW
jgi:hypothetical protein